MSVLRMCGIKRGGDDDTEDRCSDGWAPPVPSLNSHADILYPVDIWGQFTGLIDKSENETTITAFPFNLQQPLPGVGQLPRMVPEGILYVSSLCVAGTENDLPYDLTAELLGAKFVIGKSPMQRDPGSEIVIIAPPVAVPIDISGAAFRGCVDPSGLHRIVDGHDLSPLECLGFDEKLLWENATATPDGRVVVPVSFPYVYVLFRAAVLNLVSHRDDSASVNDVLCQRTLRAWYVPVEALRAAVRRVENMARDVIPRNLVLESMNLRRADGKKLNYEVDEKMYTSKFSVLIKFKISWHQFRVPVPERSPSPLDASADDQPS